MRACWAAVQPVPGNALLHSELRHLVSSPQIAHPSALLRHRSTCGQSFTSLPCSTLHRAMISVQRGIPGKLRSGLLLSTQIAVMETICPVGICGAPWAKGRLLLLPPALGCIITSQTQSCRSKSGLVAQHISRFHRGFARLCKGNRPSRVQMLTSIVRNCLVVVFSIEL